MFPIPESFLARLSGAHRLLIFILVVALSATLIALAAGGWESGLLIGLLAIAILMITRPLWKPDRQESFVKVGLTSLGIISSVALAVLGKSPEARPVIGSIAEHFGLGSYVVLESPAVSPWIATLVLTFTLAGIFIINWLTRDKSAMQRHPRPLDKDFPEQTYRKRLLRYSAILKERLNALDEQTRWDDYFFTPLEAEVEVTSGRRTKKKIVNLMTALKSDRTSRVILVLGDPGAGKSTALRKLARDLLKEADRTGRVPVYVNLKEWATKRSWTKDTPPSIAELRAFILGTLKGGNIFADQFLEDYFDKMLDRGRFFLLLDSFDEIPGVLDITEGSWLIQHLSRVISELFTGQENGRGIVASRMYRRPRFSRLGSATFEIRPFSDMRIHEALMKTEKLSASTIERLFRERTELVAVARNPFSAALIRIYAEKHGGQLPSNQLEMYEDYVRGRLARSAELLEEHDLKADQVTNGATEIAWSLFTESEFGLEAPVGRLGALLPGLEVQPIAEVLRYSGLARLSVGTDPRFSFAHRRLNEYFVACQFRSNPHTVDVQAIPTDSRYRDALALYCEVGDAQHVKEIADFCWSEIEKAPGSYVAGQLDDTGAVHCLRFLRDAFRSRPGILTFRENLGNYIDRRLEPGGDLLAAKIALEVTGLLPETQAVPVLIKALEMGNSWVSETALRACRHLKQIDSSLDRSLFRYLNSIPIPQFLRRGREIAFSLSLSDAFRDLRRYCMLRSVQEHLFVVSFGVLLLISPLLALVIVLMWAFQNWVNSHLRSVATANLEPDPAVRLYASLLIITVVTSSFGSHPADWRTRDFLPLLTLGGLATLKYAAFVYMAVGILLSPWAYLAHGFRRVRWREIITWARFRVAGTTAAMFIAVLLCISGLVYLLEPWLDRHKIYKIAILLVLLLTAGAGLLNLIVRGLRLFYEDRKHLRQAIQVTAVSRSAIRDDFLRFRTARYRTRYVDWLRDAHVQPVGEWNGARPNVRNDRASTLLAQLDAHWLGIES